MALYVSILCSSSCFVSSCCFLFVVMDFSLCTYSTTLCLKKCVNFEMVQLEIIRINFDDIWQKYSKYSRIEFLSFSFCVGLLFYINIYIMYINIICSKNTKASKLISYQKQHCVASMYPLYAVLNFVVQLSYLTCILTRMFHLCF